MYVGKDNSKPLGPAWTFIAGILLLCVACGLLWFVIVALKTGEIWRFSKMHPGLATRQDSPEQFWYSVVFSSIIGIMLAALSVWILRDLFKKTRR